MFCTLSLCATVTSSSPARPPSIMPAAQGPWVRDPFPLVARLQKCQVRGRMCGRVPSLPQHHCGPCSALPSTHGCAGKSLLITTLQERGNKHPTWNEAGKPEKGIGQGSDQKNLEFYTFLLLWMKQVKTRNRNVCLETKEDLTFRYDFSKRVACISRHRAFCTSYQRAHNVYLT